jgi:hypothetical protein
MTPLPLYRVLLKTTQQTHPILVLVSAPDQALARSRILTRYPDTCDVVNIEEVDADEETIFQVRAIFQRVRITVTNCASSSLWYRRCIGKQFDGVLIADSLKGEGYVTNLYDVITNDHYRGSIGTEDCKIDRIERYSD